MIFEKYELVIFDADGTLRECSVPGQDCPVEDDQWFLIPAMIEELSKYDWKTKHFGIASNQSVISRGLVSAAKCQTLIKNMVLAAFGFLPPAEAIQFCPHYNNDGCDCRKPEPGMLKKIMAFFKIDPEKTLFVGDSEVDKKAAIKAGCDFVWVSEIGV